LIDFLLGFLEVIAVSFAILAGYYATRILIHMRSGRMERGWQYITVGFLLLVVRSIFTAIEDAGQVSGSADLNYDTVGTALAGAGFILLVLGFRSLYRAWTLKDLVAARKKEYRDSIPS
jgi:hypothetical protein